MLTPPNPTAWRYSPARIADRLLEPVLPAVSRRRWLWTAAAIGLALGLTSRLWMRSISNEPQFSIGGTVLILLVFCGLGALAGLATWWLRTASARRQLVQRGVAFLPFTLMGPFMLLFLPGLILAFVQTRVGWRRRSRWPLLAVAGIIATFLLLAFLQRPWPLATIYAPLGYVVLASALYVTNRIALAPRRGVLL
jgi:hypothetical protein